MTSVMVFMLESHRSLMGIIMIIGRLGERCIWSRRMGRGPGERGRKGRSGARDPDVGKGQRRRSIEPTCDGDEKNRLSLQNLPSSAKSSLGFLCP